MNKNAIDVSRYTNVDTWDFTIEVVTPAFLGGSDTNAELRSASFKGLLRYWWRVLYGAKYGYNILKKESEIFGSSTGEKKNQIGKSNVQVTVCFVKENIGCIDKLNGKKKPVTSKGKTIEINVLEYLAFGVSQYDKLKHRNIISRTALKPGTQFNLKLIINKNYSTEVLQAFLFLCKYGGIGSKNRNGFGSLKIVNSTPDVSDLKISDYVIGDKLQYSALSKQSKLFCTNNTYNTWEEALSELADIYIDTRRSLEKRHSFMRRGLLARPIISKMDKFKIPENVYKRRHPKFIIMNISQSEDGHYKGSVLTLPIEFYEQENKIEYDKMVRDVHVFLSQRMMDITSDLIGELQ